MAVFNEVVDRYETICEVALGFKNEEYQYWTDYFKNKQVKNP